MTKEMPNAEIAKFKSPNSKKKKKLLYLPNQGILDIYFLLEIAMDFCNYTAYLQHLIKNDVLFAMYNYSSYSVVSLSISSLLYLCAL